MSIFYYQSGRLEKSRPTFSNLYDKIYPIYPSSGFGSNCYCYCQVFNKNGTFFETILSDISEHPFSVVLSRFSFGKDTINPGNITAYNKQLGNFNLFRTDFFETVKYEKETNTVASDVYTKIEYEFKSCVSTEFEEYIINNKYGWYWNNSLSSCYNKDNTSIIEDRLYDADNRYFSDSNVENILVLSSVSVNDEKRLTDYYNSIKNRRSVSDEEIIRRIEYRKKAYEQKIAAEKEKDNAEFQRQNAFKDMISSL